MVTIIGNGSAGLWFELNGVVWGVVENTAGAGTGAMRVVGESEAENVPADELTLALDAADVESDQNWEDEATTWRVGGHFIRATPGGLVCGPEYAF